MNDQLSIRKQIENKHLKSSAGNVMVAVGGAVLGGGGFSISSLMLMTLSSHSSLLIRAMIISIVFSAGLILFLGGLTISIKSKAALLEIVEEVSMRLHPDGQEMAGIDDGISEAARS